MAKIYFYIVLTIVMMILLNVAGYNTASGVFMQKIGIIKPSDVSNYENTPWYSLFNSKIGLLVVGGAVFLGATILLGSATAGISAAIALDILIIFIGDLISVIKEVNNIGASGLEQALGYLVFIIMLPIIVLYAIALWDWIRGMD